MGLRTSLAVWLLSCVCMAADVALAEDYTITTFAGNVGYGSADGTGDAAKFQSPEGAATDSSGNLYLADTENGTIRKVTPAGVVTTVAGSAGLNASMDGTGTGAYFDHPFALAVDASGNIYVLEHDTNAVRKITPSGVVTTFAGMISRGWADGTGKAARFNNPMRGACDSSGNLYLADADSSTIRKVTPAGDVSTLAGLVGQTGSADGTGSAARFDHPEAVAVDAAGNIYVADSYNCTIRKISPAGVVITLAGLPGKKDVTDGTGAAARFMYPSGIAVDGGGNVFVADRHAATIRKVTPAGVVSTLAGVPLKRGPGPNGGGVIQDGLGGAARFKDPSSLAIDSNGSLFVADDLVIRKVAPDGMVTTFAGTPGVMGTVDGTGASAHFLSPSGVAVDTANNIYVVDRWAASVRKITPAADVTTLVGNNGWGGADGDKITAQFDNPEGVAVDGSGIVYVMDSNNQTIRRVTQAGDVTTLAGILGYGSADGTGSAARFHQPGGIAADGSGNVYVADTYNNTLRKITPAGDVTTLAGSPGVSGSADGAGALASFDHPTGLAADGSGYVYVSDTYNSTIRKVSPAGDVTTLAGTANASGSTDGNGSAARFSNPGALCADGGGNLFVADESNCIIRKITPAADVITYAGSVGESGYLDGTGTKALFSNVLGMAADGSGNVFAVDTSNNTVRKITPAQVVTSFIGSTGRGSTDANGGKARFDAPMGMAADGAGNVYVADSYNATVRKITPAGDVTTLAGSAKQMGAADGAGSAARFAWPSSVAVDSAGNVFVSDSSNFTIRKITPAGVVSTVAGMHSFGVADGSGSAAHFGNPAGNAADSSGNLYVADRDNHTIRKITPAGAVTTFAGTPGVMGSADGTGSAALFNAPECVAVNLSTGDVYVSDTGNNTIRKITPAGAVTTLAGTAGPGGYFDATGASAQFSGPTGIAADNAGYVYVSDTRNHCIRRIDPGAMVSTYAGTPGFASLADGSGVSAAFNGPTGLALSGLTLYVSDTENNCIRMISSDVMVATIAGSVSSGSTDANGTSARFFKPMGIAIDASGNLYVSDSGNNTVRLITPAMDVSTLAGIAGPHGSADGTGGAAAFDKPTGIAADSGGLVYVSDSNNNTIRKISGSTVTTFAGTAPGGYADGNGSAARFGYPAGVAVDGSGNLFVADAGSNTIRKVSPAGDVTTFAGMAGPPGAADGTGSAARFAGPTGIAVDGSGNVFVTDNLSCLVRKITPSGAVTTLAGQANISGSDDGNGAAALFNCPAGIALDSSGNLFVADSSGPCIRKINPAGDVVTIAGYAGTFDSQDGTGPAALFAHPVGMAVLSDGTVYISDAEANVIRKGTGGPVRPSLTGIAFSSNPALRGDAVSMTPVASNPSGVALTYSWQFGDSTPGETANSASHVYSTAGQYTVTLTGSDGTSAYGPVQAVVTIEAPNSGGEGVKNISDNKPPVTNPLDNVSISLTKSDGGVVELYVDVNALNRAAFDVSTDFDGVLSRVSSRTGEHPVAKFTESGVYAATSQAMDTGTSNVRGRARKTLIISHKEVGKAVSYTKEPDSSEIVFGSMRGKFRFAGSSAASSSASSDQVSLSVSLELPEGLNVGAEQDLWVGVGNVLDHFTVDAKGKAKAADKGYVTKVSLKYPKVDKTTKLTAGTAAQRKARLNLTLNASDLTGKGFDTEGVAPASGGKKLNIQAAILFSGMAYEAQASVDMKVTKKQDSGSFSLSRQ